MPPGPQWTTLTQWVSMLRQIRALTPGDGAELPPFHEWGTNRIMATATVVERLRNEVPRRPLGSPPTAEVGAMRRERPRVRSEPYRVDYARSTRRDDRDRNTSRPRSRSRPRRGRRGGRRSRSRFARQRRGSPYNASREARDFDYVAALQHYQHHGQRLAERPRSTSAL